MEMVKTKKRFIELINQMEEPQLIYGDYGHNSDFTSMSFLVKDKIDRNKRFYLPGCRYSYGQDLQVYEKREKKLIIKYEKWLYETWGNCGSVVRE